MEMLLITHYVNVICSFLFCLEPFCCCVPGPPAAPPLGSQPPAAPHAGPLRSPGEIAPLRRLVDQPRGCTLKLQEIFTYTIQLKENTEDFNFFLMLVEPLRRKPVHKCWVCWSKGHFQRHQEEEKSSSS